MRGEDTDCSFQEAHDLKESHPTPSWVIWTIAATTCVSGTMAVIAIKMQNRVKWPICTDCDEEYFDQPYWQTLVMFGGEALCLLVWWGEIWWRNRQGRRLMYLEFPSNEASFNKPRTPYWWWVFPALADLMCNVLINMAYTMTHASTILVLSNTSLIFTSILSVLMMRRPLRVHEWFGILVMAAAMSVASVQVIRNPETETNIDSDRAWLGIILTLMGSVIGSVQFVLEEWFYKRTYFAPLGAMGIQGLWGMLMSGIAIGICHSIDLYDFRVGWYQMNRSTTIRTGNILQTIASLISNGSGLCTTKLGSGLLREVVWALRSPIIWIIELCLRWQGFAWEQLVALILSIAGFCIYVHLLPTCGSSSSFDRKMKQQVPCFCIRPIVSDGEEAGEAKIGRAARAADNDVAASGIATAERVV